MKAVSLT